MMLSVIFFGPAKFSKTGNTKTKSNKYYDITYYGIRNSEERMEKKKRKKKIKWSTD